VANAHKNTRHGNAIAAQTRHLVYIAKARTQHGIMNAQDNRRNMNASNY